MRKAGSRSFANEPLNRLPRDGGAALSSVPKHTAALRLLNLARSFDHARLSHAVSDANV